MSCSEKEASYLKKKQLTSVTIVSVLTDMFQRKKQGKKEIASLSGGLSRSGRLPWEAKDKIHSKVSRAACWAELPWNSDLIARAREQGGGR